MIYKRVIPRDFFNEAKLLKCMGLLSLKILDYQLPEGIKVEIQDNDQSFRIELTEAGSLYVANYRVTINDIPVFVGTTYNSKENFPLHCEIDYTEYRIFDESGEFTDEFKAIGEILQTT